METLIGSVASRSLRVVFLEGVDGVGEAEPSTLLSAMCAAVVLGPFSRRRRFGVAPGLDRAGDGRFGRGWPSSESVGALRFFAVAISAPSSIFFGVFIASSRR